MCEVNFKTWFVNSALDSSPGRTQNCRTRSLLLSFMCRTAWLPWHCVCFNELRVLMLLSAAPLSFFYTNLIHGGAVDPLMCHSGGLSSQSLLPDEWLFFCLILFKNIPGLNVLEPCCHFYSNVKIILIHFAQIFLLSQAFCWCLSWVLIFILYHFFFSKYSGVLNLRWGSVPTSKRNTIIMLSFQNNNSNKRKWIKHNPLYGVQPYSPTWYPRMVEQDFLNSLLEMTMSPQNATGRGRRKPRNPCI